MTTLYRIASYAAFIILAGMLIHLMNASYLEPTYLGFVDKAKDYGDMAKIQNAIEACSLDALQLCSFKYSGFAHMVNGMLFMLLGVAVRQMFGSSNPVISQLCFVAGLVAGFGFLLTGISDIPGTAYAGLLRELNPEHNAAILLMTTMIRGIVNMLAITGLGWFAAFTGYAVLTSGVFSKWGAYYGYILLLPGLGGLVNPIFGFMYIALVLPWLFWLGMQFSKAAKS
ncbi:MAG: hypothetical protein GY727_09290 [Gammaproteobacteria bacterium]|nr:hypothetical protein [Gammaproteobacteria bacterium]MCP4089514.1 hypothetical protein [Gammaproteobacteria bacterium]MCP4276220.1 hypothetical protein [Gammaproteobacteria bacterium]MCP4832917.1 hypothetical protein [Gammaproteobacteria bacterium]MCP4930042.1 hypothetical protein [Gammaproteobacteria bacterium]